MYTSGNSTSSTILSIPMGLVQALREGQGITMVDLPGSEPPVMKAFSPFVGIREQRYVREDGAGEAIKEWVGEGDAVHARRMHILNGAQRARRRRHPHPRPRARARAIHQPRSVPARGICFVAGLGTAAAAAVLGVDCALARTTRHRACALHVSTMVGLYPSAP